MTAGARDREGLRELRRAWIRDAGWYRNARGRVACFLWRYDDRHFDCAGRLEGIHLIGRQRVRNRLWGVDPEIVTLAEWDPRNAAVGCTLHHRRFDSHATPTLRVPIHALRREALEFVTDYGLEADAESRFTGAVDLALAMSRASAGSARFSPVPESAATPHTRVGSHAYVGVRAS